MAIISDEPIYKELLRKYDFQSNFHWKKIRIFKHFQSVSKIFILEAKIFSYKFDFYQKKLENFFWTFDLKTVTIDENCIYNLSNFSGFSSETILMHLVWKKYFFFPE